MDERNRHYTDWDDSIYGTGPTQPPKNRGGAVALMLILTVNTLFYSFRYIISFTKSVSYATFLITNNCECRERHTSLVLAFSTS